MRFFVVLKLSYFTLRLRTCRAWLPGPSPRASFCVSFFSLVQTRSAHLFYLTKSNKSSEWRNCLRAVTRHAGQLPLSGALPNSLVVGEPRTVASSAPKCALGLARWAASTTKKWLFGKRSASGRRQRPGSGGQVTEPAGAIHRQVLWVGGLSTAGVVGDQSWASDI